MATTDITFADFWTAYALKRDRQRAERAWNRLPLRDRRAAYQGIAAYREQCQQSGISMMYAQGYLNNRRWEDEPLSSPAPPQEQPAQRGGWKSGTKTEHPATAGMVKHPMSGEDSPSLFDNPSEPDMLTW